ncbi:MAG: PspC domain-containing protein [Candidatus Thorarchaeota archaeon]|jgi:phage shock protein C
MPKKKPPARKKHTARKSKKPVRHTIDRGVRHFSTEVGRAGERFGRRMEAKGKEWEMGWHRTFGIFGPLIKSVFSLLILIVISMVLIIVNSIVSSPIFLNISTFIIVNAGFFFVLFLAFSYFSYFSRQYPKESRALSPLVTAIGIAIALWIVILVMGIANTTLEIPVLSNIALIIGNNLVWIFIAVIIIGYIVFAVKTSKAPLPRREIFSAKRLMPKGRKSDIPRLYRSGRDKILGGVCGGIGEYLSIDPVLVRVLWIVFAFAFGGGILAYIIAWIIIPRNPRYRWD